MLVNPNALQTLLHYDSYTALNFVHLALLNTGVVIHLRRAAESQTVQARTAN
jgi:hypothetical protein